MRQDGVWVIVSVLGGLGGCGNQPAPEEPEMPSPPMLSRIDQESPGAHCMSGGIAIHTGLDRNHNGTLDDAEIDRTEYACSGELEIWTGNFGGAEWMVPEKVSQLSHLRVILGSLFIPANTPVSLPLLEYVSGDVQIGDSATSEVTLPALQVIGGGLIVGGAPTGLHLDNLRSLSSSGIALDVRAPFHLALPSLISIGGSLRATPLAPVTAIDLPVLQLVRSSVSLDGMPMMTEISMPQIVEIRGSLVLAGMPALTTLDIASLLAVGGEFFVADLPALHALQLPLFRVAAGLGFSIQTSGFEELNFPALQDIQDCPIIAVNPRLRSVSFPVLTHMTCLSIYDSPPLARVSAPMIESLESLGIIGGGGPLTLDFTALTRVRTFVDLRTASLADLSGLRALTDADELTIDHIDQLPDLRGLAALRNLSTLQITSSRAMTSLVGLGNVTRLGTRLAIIDNASLRDLAGLQNLTSAALVSIGSNPVLSRLELPRLMSVEGFLSIVDMPSLLSLSGLDPLRSVTGDVIIERDPMLTDPEIAAFRARVH